VTSIGVGGKGCDELGRFEHLREPPRINPEFRGLLMRWWSVSVLRIYTGLAKEKWGQTVMGGGLKRGPAEEETIEFELAQRVEEAPILCMKYEGTNVREV